MATTIRTNNVPRPVIYGHELTAKERAEFDYLDFTDTENSEGWFRTFFRYKGNLYDLGDCMAVEPMNTLAGGWDGYYGESYFSAVLVKFCRDNEYVIIGQAFC